MTTGTWYLVGVSVFGDRHYAYCDTESCKRWQGGCKSDRPDHCPHGRGDGWPGDIVLADIRAHTEE